MSLPGAPDRLAIVLTPFARPDVVAGACRQLGMTDAVAVPARSGVVVTRPLPARVEHTDWDIAELFGEAPSSDSGQDDAAAPGGAAGTAVAGTAGAPDDNTARDDAAPDAATPAGEVTAADAVARTPAPKETAGEELATAMSTITRRGVVLVLADLGVDTGVETGLAGHVVAREWTAGEPGDEVPPGLLLANADDVVEDIVLGRRAPDEIPGAIRASDATGRGRRRRMFGRGEG